MSTCRSETPTFAIAPQSPNKKTKLITSTSAMANNRTRTAKVHHVHVGRSTEETAEALKATIAQLRWELDVERKSIRQLRREKVYEVQLAREQERNRAAVSLKETATRLHQEREQEVETLRCRHKADVAKVLKQKEKELNSVRKDLVKCQDELKEEVSKRGLSTSARAAFDLERFKLLQEIKELNASKKQTEDLLCSALEVEKQKTYDFRQLQLTSRIEVAKINKEANTEMKRLLEELRCKDHQLAALKGHHSISKYSTKHHPEYQDISLGELLSLSTGTADSLEKKLPTSSEVKNGSGQNLNLQRKYYELEKQLKHMVSVNYGFIEKNNEFLSINGALESRIDELVEERNRLNIEVNSQKDEIKRLNELLNPVGRNFRLVEIRGILKTRDQKSAVSHRTKTSKRKRVRFQLLGENCEVYGGSDDGKAVDKGGGGEREDPADVVRSTDSAPAAESSQLDWQIQRESLEIVIHSLEEKLLNCQETEKLLKLKNREVSDQNEDLEFQILELENATDEKKLNWEKEKESLKSELSILRNKLSQNVAADVLERNTATQCDEAMIAESLVEQQNAINELKMLSSHKVRGAEDAINYKGAEVEGTTSSVDQKVGNVCVAAAVENLKRRLNQSKDREIQMKEQMLLLEEEKNRQIKILQRQIDSYEGAGNYCYARPAEEKHCNETDARETSGADIFPICEGNNVKNCETKEKLVKLELCTDLNWISDSRDVFSAMPACLYYELNSSDDYKEERNEELCRQISDLERDRGLLQEIIHKDENAIQELHAEIARTKQSESDLQQLVDELETSKRWMERRVDEMTSQNYETEMEMEQLKTSEGLLRSTLQKMKEVETDLRSRLEEILEEKRNNESVQKRRLSEAEVERKLLQDKLRETEEQLGDLESSDIMLKQKVKRMEKAENYLRNELEDAKRECHHAVNHLAELQSEKDALMQKLERAYLDFTAELVLLRQEQEEKNVEMIEIGCKVKVLEQSLACREMTISKLESKLHECEFNEKELLRRLMATENVNCLMPYGAAEIPLWHLVKDGNLVFQPSIVPSGCSHRANDDPRKRIQQNHLNRCACDNHLPANNKVKDDGSKESISVSQSSGRADDVESADEASEIIDEDDGAAVTCLSGSDHWHQLVQDPDSTLLYLGPSYISASVSSLDSISDSGLESFQQDGIAYLRDQRKNFPELLSLVVGPNATICQTGKKSLIPISVRYIPSKTESHNLASTTDITSNAADQGEN